MEQITERNERNRRKSDKPMHEFVDNTILFAVIIMVTVFAMILVM